MPMRTPLTTLLLILLNATAAAQSGAGDDARIQQLYSEAKTAQGRGDLQAAIARYEDLIRAAPALGPAYNNLGALYFRQRQYARAAAVLAQGLKVNPAMPSASALLGISLYELGEFGRSRTQLEAALRANPNDGNARMYLAKDFMKLEDFSAAAAELQTLAVQDAKNQEVWYLLSKVYMRLSETALSKMNAIDPNSVLSHHLSAEVMESMNNYDGAIVELKKAVAMKPDMPGNHYKLGDAYWRQSQWDLAAEQFEAELQIDSGNCLAHSKAGNVVLQKNGDANTALAHLNQAISTCPVLTGALVDRARALIKLDRNENAAADLQAAAKQNPGEPNVHFLLARVYRSLGRSEDARAEMKLFSDLDSRARAAIAEQAQEVIKSKESAH